MNANMRKYALILILLFPFRATAAEYLLETIVDDLYYPWSLAFLPNGDYLVFAARGPIPVSVTRNMMAPSSARAADTQKKTTNARRDGPRTTHPSQDFCQVTITARRIVNPYRMLGR